MTGRHPLKRRQLCGAPLRDGSPCKGVACDGWRGRCEHHGAVAIGAELGWRVRGSRRAGVYVAEQASRVLVADTAAELLALVRQAEKLAA